MTVVTEHWIIYSRSFPQVIHTVTLPMCSRSPRVIFPAGAGAFGILDEPVPRSRMRVVDL